MVYFLLPKLSQLCLFRADTSLALDIFVQLKKKAAAYSKAAVKGIVTAVYSRILGKLQLPRCYNYVKI